ncbi:MAG TPA: alpha/beta hydrolase-fold protein [Pyrinomonadaceae bacterium]|nr:alpha/beta hydrolase-fold protein [Pyrinomonadaceae bacterium]
MRLRIAPKFVVRVSTVLTLSAGLAFASVSGGHQGVNTGSPFANYESGQNMDERPLSPRLAALRDRLKAGDRDALAGFWKEISKSGAPMIEGAPQSVSDMLVTILWRGTEETKSVFVFHLPRVEKPMERLLDTDIWYKTFRVQKGARFVYLLATNLPDPKGWTSLARFGNALRTDPLNPLHFGDRRNEFNPYEVTFYSAVELPSAEPQFWNVVRSGIPKGRVQRDKFVSKILGNERPVWVYTPHNFAVNKKPYRLLVLSDGGGYVNSARVATTLDNLIAEGLIPPLVAVMLDNPDRWRELSCNPAYTDFLVQEVIPWTRVNYHATDRPEQTIIGGASLGGVAAACVGLQRPDVFGNVLAQSGSFWWKPDNEKDFEWLNHQFAASARVPLRFSFEAGLMENTSGGPPGQPIPPPLLRSNRNFRDTLQSKGYSVHYTEFNGNHTMFNWRGTLARHLIALVGIKPEPKISVLDKSRVVRSATPRKPIARAEVKVARRLLQQYVGRYEIDPKFAHDFVLYVSVKDDSLWVKPSYLRARRLMAESESRFYDSEIPDLHLSFTKNENGNVIGLTLNSGQGDMRVKKMPPPVPSVTGNTTFKLTGHTDAEAVAIYGSFNNWIQTKNYCAREGGGWVCRIDLAPGKYTYRFLVDGVGLLDPTNPATEDDGQGHVDSVIVIKPK